MSDVMDKPTTSPISTRRHGDVLIVLSNNPPVNALSTAVRRGLVDAIAEAEADDSVKAVVIACEGQTFFAGADITEFGKPPQQPWLPMVVDAIEACSKPVVAAIHGTAFGGGLEVALGCHYRVADPTAKLGTPEVKLGLLPGAGGTQRLPRVAGVKKAGRRSHSAMSATSSPASRRSRWPNGCSRWLVATAFTRREVASSSPTPGPRRSSARSRSRGAPGGPRSSRPRAASTAARWGRSPSRRRPSIASRSSPCPARSCGFPTVTPRAGRGCRRPDGSHHPGAHSG